MVCDYISFNFMIFKNILVLELVIASLIRFLEFRIPISIFQMLWQICQIFINNISVCTTCWGDLLEWFPYKINAALNI